MVVSRGGGRGAARRVVSFIATHKVLTSIPQRVLLNTATLELITTRLQIRNTLLMKNIDR